MARTRAEILQSNKSYDIIIIGGGVIGATVALKTSRIGLSTLVLEKHDFSYGSSSRTSKMLTGGFNDMKSGNIIPTVRQVRERNNLIYKSLNPNVLFEIGIAFGQGKETFAFCPLCLKEKIPSDLSNFMWTFYNTKLVKASEENNRKEYFLRELKDERGFVNKFRGALARQANKILKK